MEEEDENGAEDAEGKEDQDDLELFPGGLELPAPRKAISHHRSRSPTPE